MIAPPQALVRLAEPWSQLYGDSTVIPMLVVFGHIAALVFAGGLAITLDRATLRAARGPAEVRWRQLEELRSAHQLVVVGLGLSVVTGVLLFTADLETYFGSWIYWTKIGFIVLLLFNGYRMTRIEARISSTPNAADDSGWKQLRTSAVVSLVLWFTIAFLGVALVKAA
jgi:uncharacterized membrane protein